MRLLTFNIWGAPYAKHRAARIKAFSKKIVELSPDVICFQEVFLADNRAELIEHLKDYYPHYHYFASGLIGSGLLSMSRFPIKEVIFHRFRMGGKPEDVKRGDYYTAKGIGLSRIDVNGQMVDVYNTHTHAQYEMDNDNEYAVFNETNLYEVVSFINGNSKSNPIVLCGDMNSRPDQAGYRILMALGSFVDSYYRLNGEYPISFSAENPYVNEPNQCLDYVFLKGLGASKIELCLTEHLSRDIFAYSDHYGLLAEINFEPLQAYGERNSVAVIEKLQKRIKIALAETESSQFGHLEKMVLSLLSLFDMSMTFAFLGRFNRRFGQWLRTIYWFGVLIYAVYQIAQAGLNLQVRKNTLETIQAELSLLKNSLSQLPD